MKKFKDLKFPVKAGILTAGLIFGAYLITVGVRGCEIRKNNEVTPLTQEQQGHLENLLKTGWPEKYQILTKLPYNVKPVELDVKAKAAIVLDAANGNVIWEKNADTIIPPASMTKIAVMYVIGQEIEKGTCTLDDVVPLPPQCWACNMPPHSSLMFLGKNQKVTLRELMTGLAVCSGNDASYAIAYYLYGGIEPFIEKMNAEVKKLGLTKTHFIETSGYSEKNITTAREMAALSREYIRRFPSFVKEFHSALDFSYPKESNLAPEDRGKPRAQDFSKGFPEHITMEITQKNTNPLLGKLSGCDGLKTGYIDESGYNLILTAVRENLRFLSVTMGGPGNSTKEGQAGRVHDGTEIMEWAFRTFAEYKNPYILRAYSIPLVKARETRALLVPAYKPEALLVPFSLIEKSPDPLSAIKTDVTIPPYLSGAVSEGETYGSIRYYVETKEGTSITLEEIPLVSDRNIKRAGFWIDAADSLAQFALLL